MEVTGSFQKNKLGTAPGMRTDVQSAGWESGDFKSPVPRQPEVLVILKKLLTLELPSLHR